MLFESAFWRLLEWNLSLQERVNPHPNPLPLRKGEGILACLQGPSAANPNFLQIARGGLNEPPSRDILLLFAALLRPLMG